MFLPPVVRPATPEDMPAVAVLAARLVRFHHALDPLRFLCLEPLEQGYERWLRHQLDDPKVVILVAEDAAAASAPNILGYAYGCLQPRDWNALLDACGALHDVYVDEAARRSGTGAALVEAMARRLRELGAPRMVLATAVQNTQARRLFARLGFRETMVEMTRELG